VIPVKEVSVRVRVVGGRSRVLRIGCGSTVADLLRRLGINREVVVVRINGRISPEEETLKGGESVEIVRIVTGG